MLLFSSGEKLCSAEDCIPGTGVYLRHGNIHSSLAGYVIRKTEGKEVRKEVGQCWRIKEQHGCWAEFLNVRNVISYMLGFYPSYPWSPWSGEQNHNCCQTWALSSPVRYEMRKNENWKSPEDFVVSLSTSFYFLTQVTSINPRFAKVHILKVGTTSLKDHFRGTVR